MFESGDELPDDSEYEVVIPTAPEDELSSSFSSCGSLSSRLPKHPGSPSPFHPHNANNNMPFAPQTQASGPHRQSGKKSNNGLPSHAFSRNYYCRFCNFNTTKSKAHLYHLVDIHGVDIKIFSCDRCDYASKWKCKVIRHRKMIHKINEPKFEPEMHDSRGNTRRPAQSFPPSANEFAPSLSHGLPTAASPLSVMPASLGLLDQHPAMMQAVFNNNKPMEAFEKMATKPTPISVDNSSSSSRRKQRKPQNVCKVVNGDEDGEAIYVSPKSDPAETSGVEPANLETSKVKADTEGSYDLADLFGSKDDGSSSIFNGGGWRRNLKPTAVPHTNFLGNSTISPNEDKMAAQKSPNSGNQANLSSSHGSLGESLSIVNQQPSSSIKQTDVSRSRTVSKEEEMSAEDQITLINNKCVVEMMIDDDLHYRCSECNFISKYRWKSTKHYKANHVNAKLYQCSTCEFTTNNRIDFFSHKASHSSRGFQFMVPSFHQRLQHLQGMHKCAECGYVASNKNNLDRHLMNHRENHPVKCLYCSFSSTGEAAIQRHMAEHHSQSEVPISNSSKKASPEDLEEGSTNEFGEFSCEMCEYTARNWSKMKEHMIRHQDGTPFACSYCESKYKRPADLNRHLKIKHNTCLADIGLDGPTLKGVLSSSDSSHSFVPIVPGNQEMSASDSPYLTNLKRSHVAMESPTPGSESDNDEPKRLCIDEDGANMMSLKCPKCPYVAKWKSDLERHLKVHSEEKRFPCTVCYRSYKYHGDLNVHMRKAHPNVTPRPNNQKAAGGKTPPPNVQVISNEVIVNMSHAAILNPLANFGAPQHQSLPEMFNSITSTPQMPSLKPAPQASPITQPSSPSVQKPDSSSPEKKIKKGELDPSTMVHVPGGEFKCLNCCYETTFKSHLDAHMRLHPEKPFHCMFCNYASYWRGDTKKHIEKNHPDKLPAGINPYSFVEQVFEEAVRNSPHRHKPLPEVHHVHTGVKSDKNKSAGQIWTPPTKGDTLNNDDSQDSIGQHSNPPRASKNGSEEHNGPTQIQCPHCTYTTINESRLNGHMATHYNLKIYKCPECGKRANWKWDVQKHMKNDHPDVTTDVIVMDTEEARNSLDDYLKDHPEQRGKPRLGVAHDCKPENWPKPKPVTPTAIPTTSSGSGGSGQKATSIRPFRCSVCSRRSNWKCDIRKHYRQVHPLQTDAHVQVMSKEELLAAGEKPDDVESSYPEMKARPATTSAKPFRCSVCGKNSRWKWDVTKHIKMVHRDIPSAYVIEDGSLDSSLNNGEDSSNPLTPDASITSDQDMEREGSPFTSHSNSNPSTQSFKPPNGPKLEEASGNDSRPYICSLCGKRSNWKWDVKKHIMSVHRGNIGSILDELLNKETVIYADGKTMEVDNDAKEKIQLIRTQMVENGSLDSPSPTGPNKLFSQDSPSSSCYSSLPTMVGLHSVLAPESPDNQTEEEMEAGEISADRPGASSGPIKFKCGYCFYTSASRNETVRHVRTGHPGKILRIHTINRSTKDEQTTYKAAHRSSTSSSFSAWQCSQCSFRHANKEEALVHIQNHDLYHAYQCAICDHGDDIESNVLKHIKTKHEVDNPEGALLQNMHYGMLMDSQPGSPGDAMGGNSGVSYTCNQCDMKTSWRSAIVRHIKEKHMVLPEYDIGTMFTKHGTAIRSEVGGEVQTRRYNCTICPYKTDKVSMFNEHMSRHTKNSDTDAKCPYCDYWVAASRLLHQHLKIHQRTGDLDGVNITPASENGFNRMEPKNPTVGGLAQCPDCPYRGKTKDLNQHRRLHKKRPGAEYKCPECPYWVSHGRLLQQHAKVHSPSYRRAASESLSMSSNDTSHEDVDIAAFKQHMISQSIHAVNMELTESGSERQAYKCSKCPFSSIRRKKINEHEEMHGAIMDSGLKCKFCDYYAEDRDTIVQHIKVHSLQYKGEVEDCNEENMINNNPTFLESGAGYDLKGGDGLMANLERQATGAKYCCEKCSYCSSHKGNFVRHMKLHGSQQGYTCDYCDYSVPRRELLEPHTELHRQPNRNLLATQSIMNLTKLKPISADVQLAQSAQLVDGHLTEVHDHLDLYENDPNAPLQSTSNVVSGRQPAFNRVESSEPEFIDLAELGSKVSADGMRHQEGGSRGPSEDDIEEDDEVWICRVCDRVLDSEQELVTHEKQHNE